MIVPPVPAAETRRSICLFARLEVEMAYCGMFEQRVSLDLQKCALCGDKDKDHSLGFHQMSHSNELADYVCLNIDQV